MEDSAIIVAVIAAVASVFGAIFTFFSNRYNSKTNKTTNILEEQYLKVIAPLHQALYDFKDPKKMCNAMDSIFRENYHLLPDKLFDNYVDFRNYVLSSDFIYSKHLKIEFVNQVCEFYRILRYKLGYSAIKITKKEKKSAKLLGNSRSSKSMTLLVSSYASFMSIATIIYCIYIISHPIEFMNGSYDNIITVAILFVFYLQSMILFILRKR